MSEVLLFGGRWGRGNWLEGEEEGQRWGKKWRELLKSSSRIEIDRRRDGERGRKRESVCVCMWRQLFWYRGYENMINIEMTKNNYLLFLQRCNSSVSWLFKNITTRCNKQITTKCFTWKRIKSYISSTMYIDRYLWAEILNSTANMC